MTGNYSPPTNFISSSKANFLGKHVASVKSLKLEVPVEINTSCWKYTTWVHCSICVKLYPKFQNIKIGSFITVWCAPRYNSFHCQYIVRTSERLLFILVQIKQLIPNNMYYMGRTDSLENLPCYMGGLDGKNKLCLNYGKNGLC